MHMINETKNLIELTNADIEQLAKTKNEIDHFNMKLRMLREQQLFDSLSRASKVRIELLEKVNNWISMIENRVFQQKTIDELHITKVISLLKFTGSIALKLMAQMNDIEKVFKTYVDSTLMIKDFEKKPTESDDEKNKLKNELVGALLNSLKRETQEPEVISPEEEVSEIDDAKLVTDDIENDVKNFGNELEKIQLISDDIELDLE